MSMIDSTEGCNSLFSTIKFRRVVFFFLFDLLDVNHVLSMYAGLGPVRTVSITLSSGA